jgi:hypothetical protein
MEAGSAKEDLPGDRSTLLTGASWPVDGSSEPASIHLIWRARNSENGAEITSLSFRHKSVMNLGRVPTTEGQKEPAVGSGAIEYGLLVRTHSLRR